MPSTAQPACYAVWVVYSDRRIGLFVGNNPINAIDPLGLWQFTVGGGYGVGGSVSFGHNEGRWNITANVGWAAGGKLELDTSESDVGNMHGFATRVGVKVSAEGNALRVLHGELGANEFVESDFCRHWRIKGALVGKGGLGIPGTEAKAEIGGAVGPLFEGTGWNVRGGFYNPEVEGPSIGLGAMVFGGAILGVSW